MILGAVILAVFGGGYLYWQQTNKPASTAQQPTAPAAVDAADTERLERIADLLKRAQAAERDKHLYGTDDRNATALYKAVLTLDRTHSAASNGLLEISQHYVVLAEKAIEQGRLEDGENQLQIAETVYADNPRIFTRRLALKDAQERARRQRAQQATTEQARLNQQALQKQRDKDSMQQRAGDQERLLTAAAQQEAADRKAREVQLNGLLNKAKDYLNPNVLTPARAALAYDLYREATKLAPQDTRGSQGLQRVADTYLNIAAARAAAKQYDEASEILQKGLEINPNHSQLRSLQKEIDEKKNTKKPQRTFGSF